MLKFIENKLPFKNNQNGRKRSTLTQKHVNSKKIYF